MSTNVTPSDPNRPSDCIVGASTTNSIGSRKEPTMNSIIDSPKAIREEKSVTPLNISGEPIFQRHRTTGATRYSLDGGLTWQPNVERCLEGRQLEEVWQSLNDRWSPLSRDR